MTKQKAFTLIELLIVVAIIAILAAIAVPNFLEAQVRAKVSRCKNDMRSIAVALESYRVDDTHYPHDSIWFFFHSPTPNPIMRVLTTPVAYMTSIPWNVFYNKSWDLNREYNYSSPDSKDWVFSMKASYIAGGREGIYDSGRMWALSSYGPDLLDNWGRDAIISDEFMRSNHSVDEHTGRSTWGDYYDSTNGTMSSGDIVRLGP